MADINDWVNQRQNWDGGFGLSAPSPPSTFINSLLTNGSVVEMNTAAGDDWDYTVPDGNVAFLARSCILILDVGVRPTRFGGISELTNGLLVRCYDTDGATLLKDYTADFQVKKNADFALLAGTDNPVIDGVGADAVEVRWTFMKAGGMLLLDENQIFRVTTQDDLSDLTSFRWCIQGLLYEKGVFTDKIPRLTLGSF